MSSISLTPALRGTLTSLKDTQRNLDETSLRMATGKRVNRAIDQPQNFFTADALRNRATDFQRVRTDIELGIVTIREALIGAQAIEDLLEQAKAVANESRILAAAGLPDPNVYTRVTSSSGTDLPSEILANAPVAYWRLNEAAGATASNLGSAGGVNGTYTNGPNLGQPALYTNNGDTAADFNGVNQRVNIPDSALINLGTYPERTVELVFNADTVAGRQVLYEEGATVNSLTIYIDNGNLYVEGRDSGDWGPLGLNTPVVAGQTYHVAMVFDQPNDSFTGYLNGVSFGSGSVNNAVFPSHSGDIAIGGMRGGAWFHDGSQGGDTHYFDGRISDVAIYNTALPDTEILEHYESLDPTTGVSFFNSEFEKIMNEIDAIVKDAQLRGINLLESDDLLTQLNEDFSHTLTTRGVDFSSAGLEVRRNDFLSDGEIRAIMLSVQDAIETVRLFGNTLSANFDILNNRLDFTDNIIANHQGAVDDLTLADLNEEGADLLALQTRQELGSRALGLAAESQQTVLRVFASGDNSGVFS